MEALGSLLVALGIGAVVFLIRSIHAQDVETKWRKVISDLGLINVTSKSVFLSPPIMTAQTSDGFAVTISERGGRSNRGTELGVSGGGKIPRWLSLRREGLGSTISKVFGEGDIESGDSLFDRAVLVHGEEATVLPLLSAQARRDISGMLARGLVVEDGEVKVDFPYSSPETEKLCEAAKNAISFARVLTIPNDPVGQIANNARVDPIAGVRQRCLEYLEKHHSHRTEYRDVLLAALTDPDLAIRVWAARRLGDRGVGTLLDLLDNRNTPDSIVTEALGVLGSRLPLDRGIAIIRGEDHGQKVEVIAAAARCLGRLGDPAAEPHLIALLTHGESEVCIAAAEALGALGSVAAVAPLRAAITAQRFGLGMRKAALSAIAAIQTRATGAAPGQLTIAGGESGALSLAQGESGELALTVEGEQFPSQPFLESPSSTSDHPPQKARTLKE